MIAVFTGDTWNPVLILSLSTPHHGHALVIDNHIDIHIQLNW